MTPRNMTPEVYVNLLRDLLSRDPERIRSANRVLYRDVVGSQNGNAPESVFREADLVLAEVAE